MRFVVEVPATIANLGPGFDAFGLALDLCNEFEVATADAASVRWEGEGADELPTDGDDLASRALRAAFDGEPPAIAVVGRNRIPLERGLGSSAAAAVAGAFAGALLAGRRPSAAEAFDVAARIEGHPDNAAAAAFGGVTVAVDGRVVRRDAHPGLDPVVLVPSSIRVSTAAARAALPASVPLRDAAANAARAALVLDGLTRDPSLLPHAMRDSLHEDARLALVPEVRDVAASLRADGHAVCVAGSGPSLLVVPMPARPPIEPPAGWRVLRPGVRGAGVRLRA